MLTTARPRDALTLGHLLRRGSAEERGRVFDRMAAIAPPPEGVTRDAVLSGDRQAIVADVTPRSLLLGVKGAQTSETARH